MCRPEQSKAETSGSLISPRATLAYHGGNLDSAAQFFPHAPSPWIDLSTGINSNAYPIGELTPDAWQRLPLANDIARLEHVAGQAWGVTGAGGVSPTLVAAPGTQALIQLLPRIFAARTIAILDFTYGEYERVWRDYGVQVARVSTLDQLKAFDLAIIVNPNNPTGRLVQPQHLRSLAHELAARGGSLIVDEAFMDFTPQYSLAGQVPDNVVVLRSFGKTYGLAGLRLGFAVASPKIAQSFRRFLGPWAISGTSVEIATRAYEDARWLAQEATRLQIARHRLEAELISLGFSIVGGSLLFVLAQHKQAERWFEHLASHGILTRPFSQNPHWIRFGIPQDSQWERLSAALRTYPEPLGSEP